MEGTKRGCLLVFSKVCVLTLNWKGGIFVSLNFNCKKDNLGDGNG